MNGFALLWGKILDSSIWVKESKETRLVWITMLAMKDSNGKIQSSTVGLADRAKVSTDDCKTALDILRSPDLDDTSKVENGIRIRDIPGGWQIVNHDLYRFSTEAKREFWRQSKAEQRAKVKTQIRKLVQQRMNSDATTRKDRAAFNKKFGRTSSTPKNPTTFQKEYDLDDAGDNQS